LRVIGKYFEIDEDKVSVHLQDSGDISTLEVNVELPMTGTMARHAS
jgi:septum formation topological specificity factor MinE